MPINTSGDRANTLFQRDKAGPFTEGAEHSNVATNQAVTDALFANKATMKRRCETQLGELFDNAKNSYGRSRAVGMSASEASRVVNRAFGK